jgi:hypothetical protein
MALNGYKVICPLLNFQIPNMILQVPGMSDEEASNTLKRQGEELVNGFELIRGIRLRLMSKEDLDDLNNPLLSMIQPFERFSTRMFVLESFLDDKDDFKTHQTMQNVILALRLLKIGCVSGNYTFYIRCSDTKRELSSWAMEEAPRLYGHGGLLGYALSFQEIPSLREMIKRVQAVNFIDRHSFHIAVKRFQRAYEETDDEDKLVDYMIALEALFLRGEKSGSSSGIVIAVACSSLLGKNERTREDTRNTLDEAYRIRNHIVHGSVYNRIVQRGENYFDSLRDLVAKVEDYLRQSIERLLD